VGGYGVRQYMSLDPVVFMKSGCYIKQSACQVGGCVGWLVGVLGWGGVVGVGGNILYPECIVVLRGIQGWQVG